MGVFHFCYDKGPQPKKQHKGEVIYLAYESRLWTITVGQSRQEAASHVTSSVGWTRQTGQWGFSVVFPLLPQVPTQLLSLVNCDLGVVRSNSPFLISKLVWVMVFVIATEGQLGQVSHTFRLVVLPQLKQSRSLRSSCVHGWIRSRQPMLDFLPRCFQVVTSRQ